MIETNLDSKSNKSLFGKWIARAARRTLWSPQFSRPVRDKNLSRSFPQESCFRKREQAPRTPNAGAFISRPVSSRSVWSAPGLPALCVQVFKAAFSPGPVVVNGQDIVTNPFSGTQQFFRLTQ
jgi:hypothetical protein